VVLITVHVFLARLGGLFQDFSSIVTELALLDELLWRNVATDYSVIFSVDSTDRPED